MKLIFPDLPIVTAGWLPRLKQACAALAQVLQDSRGLKKDIL